MTARDEWLRDHLRNVRRITWTLAVGGLVLLALWVALTAAGLR